MEIAMGISRWKNEKHRVKAPRGGSTCEKSNATLAGNDGEMKHSGTIGGQPRLDLADLFNYFIN